MIFSIEKGILCQQVNCQNRIGAGLSGAIIQKYPIVEQKYHEAFLNRTKEELFGKIQVIPVEEGLSVANLFTQFSYGNAKKTGEVYTDTEKLLFAIDKLAEKYRDQEIYVPAYIGCGLAGGNWSRVSGELFALERPNLFLIDTLHEPFSKTPLFIPQLSLRDDFPVTIDPALYTNRILAFDTETTGVTNEDEILQLSIVNEKEEVVLSTYFKPEKHFSWDSAMKVNHITPEMVKKAPLARQYRSLLQEIFSKADVVVAHNASFDVRMLKNIGVVIPAEKVFCTCNAFKQERKEGHHTLMDAVLFYCPQAKRDLEGSAHNALPDTIAALRVYLSQQLKKEYFFVLAEENSIRATEIKTIFAEFCHNRETENDRDF